MTTVLSSLHNGNFMDLFDRSENCQSDIEIARSIGRTFINIDINMLRGFSKTFNDQFKGGPLEGKIKRAFVFSTTELATFLKSSSDAKYIRLYNGLDANNNHVAFGSLINANNEIIIGNGTFILSDLPCPPRPNCPGDPILQDL